MPMPPMEGNAATFMGGLGASGYMFPLLGILEILIGILLIMNKAVPFALILLAPLAVNMVLFQCNNGASRNCTSSFSFYTKWVFNVQQLG